jgi:GH25 family lysozyme M1 (1,4-beta-N-acetylmuramidase)
VALVRGIDVSSYQTVTSWSSVRDARYRYAIVKATEGEDFTSPTFFEYYRDARAAELIVGSYHFARPGSSSAGQQAAFYVRRLREAGFRSRRDLPPNLDIEDTGGMSSSGLTAWCLEFLEEVDRRLDLTGEWSRCGFYCNRDYYQNRLNGERLNRGRWFWLALWPAGQDQPTEDNEMPAGATVWQWTDQGDVPGIRENTDLNVVRDVDLRRLSGRGEDDDMPVFRHYGVTDALPVSPPDSNGDPRPRTFNFDVDWADPHPAAHKAGSASYTRHSVGWSDHELSGVRVEGMSEGDPYQIELIAVHPTQEEIQWRAVLHEGRAAPGRNEYVSVTRTLKSGRDVRVRWRFVYRGRDRDVRITRAEWVIKEY